MSRDLYLQQKGIEPKAGLNQTTMLESLLKEYIGDVPSLTGITKTKYNKIYALFFQKKYDEIKEII